MKNNFSAAIILPAMLMLTLLSAGRLHGQYLLRGKIATQSGEPLPYATVRLYQYPDSVVAGQTLADSAGWYRFQLPAPGSYQVRTSYLNFQEGRSAAVVVMADKREYIVHLMMSPSTVALKEVSINLKKPLISADKGKVTFNLANNATTAGVSAFDILRRLPGVSIGQDDEILLQGTAGVQVMVDGKLSYVSGNQLGILLKGLSGDELSKVELINSPSAGYDAAGNAGIINIVTKRHLKKGYALSLKSSLSIGAFVMNNQNVSASINSSKWRGYVSFDYNTPHRARNSTSGNTIREAGQPITLERSNYVPFYIYYYTWKAGSEWQFAPQHKIGVHYHGYFDDFSGAKTSDIVKRRSDGGLDSKVLSNIQLLEPYYYDAVNVDYRYDIDKKGKQLTADARYISYRNFSDALMQGKHYDADGHLQHVNVLRTHQPGFIKIKSVQTDASLPFDGLHLKTGVKFAEVSNDNNYHSEELIDDVYVPVPHMTDHFQYKEQIGAAYVSASRNFGATSVEAGLRLEHTSATINSLDASQRRQRHYTKLFPNLSVSRQFSTDHKLDFSISRRINRPAYSELNPVRWYNDEYFYYYGNPDLVPEMAWLFSGTYTWQQRYIFTATYSKRQDYISRGLSYDPNGVTVRSQSANFPHFDRIDLHVITPIQPTSFWDMQLFAGVNYTAYPISELGKTLPLSRWATTFSLQQQVKLLRFYSLDVSMKYTSEELRGVYLSQHVFFTDIGIKRSFLGGKLSTTLTCSDLFNTYREQGRSLSTVTNYYYTDKPDSRRLTFTVQYNLGGTMIREKGTKTDEQNRL